MSFVLLSISQIPTYVKSDRASVALNFLYFNQFLLGFRGTTFVPNINDCSNTLEQSIYNFNSSVLFLNDTNYIWVDYTFNWTRYISGSFADAYYNCMISAVQAKQTTDARIAMFGTLTDWVTGFIQNMLGNVVTF